MKVEPLKTTWARDKIPKNHQYGISALFSQTSFCWETCGGCAKCWLFFQAKYSGLVSFLFLLHFTLGGVTDLFSLTYFQAAQKAHKEVVELFLDLDSSLVKVKDKNGRKPADFVPSHEQELRDMLKAE